ncbi:MAG: adenosylcobinamide-phosphate synthase CbiB [Lachnospiraceae bacterium]|nr:adenosylcobinamide-phosphate synthase CbiB [Lachnospiraceae bacterium]
MSYAIGSLLAVVIGAVLDLLLGDPQTAWHPICLIGYLIAFLEKVTRKLFPKTKTGERAAGALCAVLVVTISTAIPAALLYVAYTANFWLGVLVDAVLCYFVLAAKTLKKESMNVGRALETEGLEAGRKAVGRIVGRDTQNLTKTGVIKAAVETVAENYADGVAAPLLFLILAGGAGGFFYKSINTMDSMLGYKNEKYMNFGWFPAHLDDIANFIPARLAALFLILSAPLCGCDGKMAWKIFRRDRYKHASPNSAQTEAAAAGALHVQLAGDAWYFGELHKKPFIGDDIRPIEVSDIAKINRMMYTAAALALVVFGAVKAVLIWVI